MSAADWIKMTHGLKSRPEVVRISSALNADRLRIIGALYVLWTTVDMNTSDGFLPGYTLALINEELGWPGFAEAVASVGWLEENAQGVVIPNFERHNGRCAKRRAQEASRGQDRREANKRPDSVRIGSGRNSDERPQTVRIETGLEKRREEKNREDTTTATTPRKPKPAKRGAAAAAVEVVMGDGERATIAEELAGAYWGFSRSTAVQLAGTHDPPTLRAVMAQASGRHVRNPGGLLLSLLADTDPERDAEIRRMEADAAAADAWVRGAKREAVHAAVGEYLASSGEPQAKLSEVVKRPAFHRWLVNESGLCRTEEANA